MFFDLYYYSLASFSFAKKVHCRLFSQKILFLPKEFCSQGSRSVCVCVCVWEAAVLQKPLSSNETIPYKTTKPNKTP